MTNKDEILCNPDKKKWDRDMMDNNGNQIKERKIDILLIEMANI